MSGSCQHGLTQEDCLLCRLPIPAEEARAAGVFQPAPPARRPSLLGTHFLLLAAVVAVIGVVAWIVAGAVFAIFHVVELLVVAVAAGWAGYRLGFYRGGRKRS
jgi:hypothetical protein